MKFLIVGCGPSAWNFRPGRDYDKIIGVNDASRWCNCDELVVVNSQSTFPEERWQFIRDFKGTIHTHLSEEELPVKTSTKFLLGEKHRCCLDCPEVDYSFDSPYIAILIAYRQGAKEIDLIGVDFINHPHLEKRISHIQRDYNKLNESLRGKGVVLKNLSPTSLILQGI